jgi:hypothetical protein
MIPRFSMDLMIDGSISSCCLLFSLPADVSPTVLSRRLIPPVMWCFCHLVKIFSNKVLSEHSYPILPHVPRCNMPEYSFPQAFVYLYAQAKPPTALYALITLLENQNKAK